MNIQHAAVLEEINQPESIPYSKVIETVFVNKSQSLLQIYITCREKSIPMS